MRQMFYEGPRTLTWRDAPEPQLGADHEAIVETIAATACDVDKVVIEGRSPFQPPFALGHEAVARVVDKGDAVSGLEIGDVVCVPYHRTCGQCGACAGQTPLHCEQKDTPMVPSYGFPHAGEWGGMFAERFRVPFASHALVTLPDSVDPIAAVSVGDNLTDAWSTTAKHLRDKPGGRVLVLSFGGYGLYAVQWALSAQAQSVTLVDDDPKRLELVESWGARGVLWSPSLDLTEKFDVIVNARAEPEALHLALRAAAPDAVCESTAIHFADVPLPLTAMHFSGVRLRSSFASTRVDMPEVVAALAAGQIDPRLSESEIVSLDDAPRVLAEPSWRPVLVF